MNCKKIHLDFGSKVGLICWISKKTKNTGTYTIKATEYGNWVMKAYTYSEYAIFYITEDVKKLLFFSFFPRLVSMEVSEFKKHSA